MRTKTLGIVSVTCLAISLGWPATNQVEAGEANSKSTKPESPKSAAATKSVSLEIRSWSDFQKWVAKQKGKVVVVDVWSTSCDECVKEFPHFVALHKRLGNKVVCASFNIDFFGVGSPKDVEPDVLKFLKAKHATSSNFLSSTTDEKVMKAMDVASIPTALVYDQSGKLRKTFKNDNNDYGPNGFNYKDHINPFVEELVKPRS